jgi:secreted trypsin-like serine protease
VVDGTLVGLVSWGIACDGTAPGVYANVFVERNWIERVVASFDT